MPFSQASRTNQPGAQAQWGRPECPRPYYYSLLPFLVAMEEVVPPSSRTLLKGKQVSGGLSASAEHHTSVSSPPPSPVPRKGAELTQ